MALSHIQLTTNITGPTNETELTHVFKNSQTLHFEDKYHHYIHPVALRGITQLSITGLRDAEIHFLAPLQGATYYQGDYRHDSGVLNLIDCHNCTISGAFVNSRPYNMDHGGDLREQTAVAVNVARSTVKFQFSKFFSEARLPVMVHSGSTVEIEDSQIEGDYFELFNSASSLTVRRSEVIQNASFPDSHSMLWTGSSHRSGVDNALYENSHTIFDKVDFKLFSGRALVSGNGSYHTMSNVEFRNGCQILERDEHFGIVSWHGNYNSITVNTNKQFGEYTDDIVRTSGSPGFGRFIDYYPDGGGKPGGPGDESPIFVDGMASSGIAE